MSERVSVGSWPRRTLAGWLRLLADRLAPQREITVRLTADTREFERGIVQAKERLARHAYMTDPWPYAHVRQGEQPDPLAPPPNP